MAELVALHDAQGAVVWINPSWVKMVRDAEGGGTMIEFMDGERMPVSNNARIVLKRMNASLAPKPPAAPADESAPAETPAYDTAKAQPPQASGIRDLLKKVAPEA